MPSKVALQTVNTSPQDTSRILPNLKFGADGLTNQGNPLNAVKPLAPIPSVTGSTQNPQAQNPFTRPQPTQPQQQPNAQLWKPSVVSQVAASKGDPNASIMNMFKPQQPQQAQLPMKQACVLSQMFMKQATRKLSALHATGDPLPKDWNMTLDSPSKMNGGVPSYGREAWDTVKEKRHRSADKDNFDKAWHTNKGRVKKSAGKGIGSYGMPQTLYDNSENPTGQPVQSSVLIPPGSDAVELSRSKAPPSISNTPGMLKTTPPADMPMSDLANKVNEGPSPSWASHLGMAAGLGTLGLGIGAGAYGLHSLMSPPPKKKKPVIE